MALWECYKHFHGCAPKVKVRQNKWLKRKLLARSCGFVTRNWWVVRLWRRRRDLSTTFSYRQILLYHYIIILLYYYILQRVKSHQTSRCIPRLLEASVRVCVFTSGCETTDAWGKHIRQWKLYNMVLRIIAAQRGLQVTEVNFYTLKNCFPYWTLSKGFVC